MARARLPLTKLKAADLPAVCMICARPADAHVTRTFVWRPSWRKIALLISVSILVPAFCILMCLGLATGWQNAAMGCVCTIPIGVAPLLISLIAGFIHPRRCQVECPVCARHRRYWIWRGFWMTA